MSCVRSGQQAQAYIHGRFLPDEQAAIAVLQGFQAASPEAKVRFSHAGLGPMKTIFSETGIELQFGNVLRSGDARAAACERRRKRSRVYAPAGRAWLEMRYSNIFNAVLMHLCFLLNSFCKEEIAVGG